MSGRGRGRPRTVRAESQRPRATRPGSRASKRKQPADDALAALEERRRDIEVYTKYNYSFLLLNKIIVFYFHFVLSRKCNFNRLNKVPLAIGACTVQNNTQKQ